MAAETLFGDPNDGFFRRGGGLFYYQPDPIGPIGLLPEALRDPEEGELAAQAAQLSLSGLRAVIERRQ